MVPVLYTKKEISGFLKISEREIGRKIEKGELTYTHKIGRRILFSEKIILEYLKSVEVSIM